MHSKVIGEAAGAVWKILGSKGRVALTTLPKLLDQDNMLVQQGVGWLAREHKVEFEKEGRALYVKLTAHEFRVLAYLMHRRGVVVSRGELTEHIYAQDADRDSNTIEVFVARLRRKLGEDVIETVRGLGYRIDAARPC